MRRRRSPTCDGSGPPAYLRLASFPRFRVAAYHQMLSAGILDEDSRSQNP
jgi:hypothetical protein